MEHVLTMANLKLKPSIFTPRPNDDPGEWKGEMGMWDQIGCFFGLSGLPMAPFLFENWFRYRSRFCKMHSFR